MRSESADNLPIQGYCSWQALPVTKRPRGKGMDSREKESARWGREADARLTPLPCDLDGTRRDFPLRLLTYQRYSEDEYISNAQWKMILLNAQNEKSPDSSRCIYIKTSSRFPNFPGQGDRGLLSSLARAWSKTSNQRKAGFEFSYHNRLNIGLTSAIASGQAQANPDILVVSF
ncbi:uncharacterized protein MYCFIDRAFT_176868 [Pseudocercospora fijiensis CIRAD86]|uniref:Uncharacterized protein n=1 Tax=Pseudocercospora fijiensis (strain CIRAD86) TaxID=383855 RepID=M3A5H6_PSEFD|nr:uncharacterized protein MYCFIDRAFT_176868 [Pseudocercospora fijiensis CIRAD86]EME79861.1 hypothetical protein MYCFIDRAFT_176868 [Pseudocercospora fijiensis CIRAD86]